MPKKFLIFSFVLFFIFCFLSPVICSLLVFAQTSEEQITITAYYPSPYGVYRELRAQRQAVGETWYSNANVCWGTGCPAGSTVIPTGGSDPDVDLVVEGNVGIGTAKPQAPLHVAGDVYATAAPSVVPGSGTAEGLRMRYLPNYWGGNYDAMILEKTDDDPYVEGGMILGVATSTGADTNIDEPGWGVNTIPVVTIRGDGANPVALDGSNTKVGIGTTNPGAKLHIVGDSSVASDRILMYLDGGGASDAPLMFRATRGGTQPITNGLIEAVTIGGHGGGETVPHFYIAAFKNDSVTPANLIRLQLVGNPIALTDGNVGIGTTDPKAKLDVVGGVKIGADSTCNSDKSGTIRYNAGQMEYCNGSSWQPLGGGLSSCVNTKISVVGPWPASKTVTCPAGYKVTGGGWNTTVWVGGNVGFDVSYPSSDTSWTAQPGGGNDDGNKFDIYARCCK